MILPADILRYLLLTIEVLLFGSFIWALVGWFKKTMTVNRWELHFIKISGIVFVIAHLAAAAFCTLPPTPVFIAGIVMLMLSALLFFWSLSVFKQPPSVAFSKEIITKLQTDGPYQFIRHPFYTSYLLAWLGGSIASGMYALSASFFIMLFIYYKAAKEEEQQWLDSNDKTAYQNYMSITGRFILNPIRLLKKHKHL